LPFVVGPFSEVSETEPNNQPSVANRVSLPTTVNGVLEKSGDVDTFSATLNAGQTLTAAVLAQRDLGSPMDAVLQVVDNLGTTVAHNDDDHDVDPRITFVAPIDGTYTVRIFAFPSAPNSTIALAGGANFIYRLTLTTGPAADYAMPYAVDAKLPSEIRLFGPNLPTAGAPTSIPEFQTSDYAVPAGTDLPLRIAKVDHTSVTEDDIVDGVLTLPISVTGLIDADQQHDTYVIEGTKGQKIDVSVESRSLYSLLDPVATVTDEAGKVIKDADDRSKTDLDTELQLTLPADGRYKIEISDRYEHGGGSEIVKAGVLNPVQRNSHHMHNARANFATAEFTCSRCVLVSW